jgi:hypothetical protein
MVKWSFSGILCLLAIVAQWWVVSRLWQLPGPFDPVAAFFAAQMVAALVAALFVSVSLPRRYGQAGNGAFASALIHAFVVCLFLPVAGLALFLGLMMVALIFPSSRQSTDFALVESPKFVSYLVSRVTHGAGARLRARIENLDGTTDDRLAAMVVVQTLPSHVTGGLLRELLSDTTEEIRLLAYGIVDSAEKAIMQQIFVAQENLAGAVAEDERAVVNARLAALHWELVYQNRVQGEVRQFSLDRVEYYARNALEEGSDNAAMWYLLGRRELLKGRPVEAQVFFEHAQAWQFPTERLIPWLAEAAYLRGQYSRLSEMLAPLDEDALLSQLRPTVSYWSE